MSTTLSSQVAALDAVDERKVMEIDLTWQMACASMTANDNQIVINAQVYHTIGRTGLEELKLRLSRALGDMPVAALIDPSTQVIRLVPAPAIVSTNSRSEAVTAMELSEGQSSTAGASNRQEERTMGKKSKIPRPPNAFILYRQHHHPTVKSHNPGLHNNEISKLLGRRWKSEPDTIKLKYKQLSDELKSRHAARYPGYQYAPRRPGEKKKRMTTRKTQKQPSTQIETESQDPAILSVNMDMQKAMNGCTVDEMMHQSRNPNEDLSNDTLLETDSMQEVLTESETLQYHGSTVSLHLPCIDQNVQALIDQGLDRCASKCEDSDAEKSGDTAVSYDTQLSGLFDEEAADQVDYLESLIDWDGLGVAMANMQEMADDLEACDAYQTISPLNSRM